MRMQALTFGLVVQATNKEFERAGFKTEFIYGDGNERLGVLTLRFVLGGAFRAEGTVTGALSVRREGVHLARVSF